MTRHDGKRTRRTTAKAGVAPDAGLARRNAELARANVALRQRIARLEQANLDARKTRLATLNVLEDAVSSKRLAETLNEQLQHENAERRQIELALRESSHRLETALHAARAAHQAKDQFMAALSHELRTPLTPILLTASLGAQDRDLPEPIRERFDLIRENIQVEARLIDDLLDQTRIVRGQTRMTKEPVDIHAILREVLRTTAPEFAAKHIHPQTDFRARAATVLGDPVRLQQIFWNILRNAVKFTPERGKVAITTAGNGDHGIVINVSDTGIGLTPAEMTRIFDPFTQGEHATDSTMSFGGLGLGLTISQKLVELHDGRLSVASRGRDRGATFTVELPCLRTETQRPQASKPAPKPRRTAAIRSLRILLVEDHAPTRAVMRKFLELRGHRVTAAESLAGARKKSSGTTFDLLVSDIALPDGTGLDLMKRLQEAQPGLPGIALSGFGMEGDIARTREAGFVLHLTKPVSLDRLESALSRFERHHHPTLPK